eukprot:19871-Eustigmatos_ZCMA.PRE.1
MGGHATPLCHGRKRLCSADEDVGDDQLVFTAATATPSGLIDYNNSSGDSADAGVVCTAGTRSGTVAAAATNMGTTSTTFHTTTQTLPASFV